MEESIEVRKGKDLKGLCRLLIHSSPESRRLHKVLYHRRKSVAGVLENLNSSATKRYLAHVSNKRGPIAIPIKRSRY